MSCSICSCSEVEFFLKSDVYGFDVYRCKNCGVLFRYPLPSNEEVVSFYDEGYYLGSSKYSYIDERKVKGSELVWERRIKKLIQIFEMENHRKPKNILDVGCSFGGLLEVARNKFGLIPVGVEVSEYSSSYAIERGIEVIKGSIESVEVGNDRFDIITMIEVIEHLKHPYEVLKKIFDANTKGGILLVQTANIDGIQSKFWGGKYHYYLPGHLHYFSNKTLRNLIFEAGYSKVYEFYPVEFGLLPKVVKVFLNNRGMSRMLKVLKTITYHLLGKVRIGDITLMSSMVMVGVKS